MQQPLRWILLAAITACTSADDLVDHTGQATQAVTQCVTDCDCAALMGGRNNSVCHQGQCQLLAGPFPDCTCAAYHCGANQYCEAGGCQDCPTAIAGSPDECRPGIGGGGSGGGGGGGGGMEN